MLKKFPAEAKVGMFTLITLIIIAWATVQVSDRSAISGGGYDLSFVIESATGLKTKAPIELAGVAVGVVKRIELAKDNRARILIVVNDKVKLPVDSQAVLRTRGFLGESYIELMPGSSREILQEDNAINQAHRSGDLNTLISEIGDIANDMKTVSSNIRKQAGPDKDAPVNLIIDNLQEFTRAIKDVTVRNTENIDRISVNLANLTSELSDFIEHSSPHAESAVENMESITAKIDRGEGTFGKLINDDETVNKINSSLDNLNDTLGGFSRLQTEIGFHTEYLSESGDFKNYVSLALKPSPDKALLIDIVSDPDPRPEHVLKTTEVTVGGTTTTVSTDTATTNRNRLRLSAQLAKTFYNFTLRGGLIESTAGMGLDYQQGPFGLRFSAFDFSNRFNEKPHLKLLGDVSLTPNIFLVGGADDMISPTQKTDYFFGAGFRFVDDDLKKFARFGGSSLIDR